MDLNSIEGTLYIVATPIGNLGDITLRALETLKNADIIAAEDTRHTIKLLNHYDIKTKMISHHEHNEEESAQGIVMLLEQGKNIALVTDAGMPCISDPGFKLVRLAREKGYKVTCVPGASAVPAAIALSGLEADRFRFEGFLPKGNTQRRDLLEGIAKDGCAVVIYEAPHRLSKTIKDVAQVFHDRKIAIINDISKMYERVEVYSADEIALAINDWNLKGEFVIVIEKGEKRQDYNFSQMTIIEHVTEVMKKEKLSKMDAVKKVAKIRGLAKREVYSETIDV